MLLLLYTTTVSHRLPTVSRRHTTISHGIHGFTIFHRLATVSHCILQTYHDIPRCMRFHGIPPISTVSHSFPDLPRYSTVYTASNHLPTVSHGVPPIFHGILGISPDFRGIPQISHDIPRFMRFHGIPPTSHGISRYPTDLPLHPTVYTRTVSLRPPTVSHGIKTELPPYPTVSHDIPPSYIYQ